MSATRSRLAKIEALSDLLRRAGEAVGTVVGFLAGTTRQGRIGAGWRTLVDLDAQAATEPTLTVERIDRAFDDIAATGGKGSAGRRTALLEDLFGAATVPEQRFLLHL